MMAGRYTMAGRTTADTVQAVLGCDADTARKVTSNIATMLEDPDTRAFIMRWGHVMGVPLDGLTGERALVIAGKREAAMFMLRCLGSRTHAAGFFPDMDGAQDG
jgi:hypothetical protein